jgi:maltooligosyltrehalose trehalohydrolase
MWCIIISVLTAITARHKTPWGDAVNYDGDASRPVRDFIIGNALYWLEEFHFDGLRLDAVHAIIDDSRPDLLTELARTVRAALRRPVHLILENEENAASRLVRDYTAQWNDDVHHVLHVAASGERSGYYAAYHNDTAKLGRALAEGFAFQGETMVYRDAPRGEPSGALPPTAFVAFIQNHDQVGNRAFGDRLNATVSPEAQRAIAAIYLLLPQVPMIFMGEEFASSQPFPFFCDFSGDLAEAVRQGRRAEFARFPEFQDPAMRAHIPDPQAAATFAAAKLDWSQAAHSPVLEWYRRILATRRHVIIPLLPSITHGGTWHELAPSAVSVRWQAGPGRVLALDANISAQAVSAPPARGESIWQEGDAAAGSTLGPWAVRWCLELT